jgi:hypothetical protein
MGAWPGPCRKQGSMRAGARGYVVKGMRSADAIRAIRSVAEGEAIFSPAIASRLVSMLSEARQATGPAVFPELTERERQTLDLMAQGPQERGHRRALAPQPEDSPQLHNEHFRQASTGGPI